MHAHSREVPRRGTREGVATGLVDAAYRSQQPPKGTYFAAGGQDGVVVVVVLVVVAVLVAALVLLVLVVALQVGLNLWHPQ